MSQISKVKPQIQKLNSTEQPLVHLAYLGQTDMSSL